MKIGKWCTHSHIIYKRKPLDERELRPSESYKIYLAECWCLDCGKRLNEGK